jgi:fumarate hydratase class II
VAETDYRIEKDSLGEVRVPTGAYWGAQTQRAVENFPISGLRQYPAFVWAMVMIKRAAAEVNNDLGLFEDREIGGQTTGGSEIARAVRTRLTKSSAAKWRTNSSSIRSRPAPAPATT